MDRSCQPGAAALARMRLPGRRDHAAGGRLLVVPCGLGPWSAPAGASSSSEKKPAGPTRPRRAPIRPSQRGQNPARAGSTQRRRLAFPARALRLSPAPDCPPIALNSRTSPPRTRAAIRRPAGRRSHRADRGRLALRQKQGAAPAGNHGAGEEAASRSPRSLTSLMRAPECRPAARPLRTTSESTDRSRPDSCFALAEQVPEEAGTARRAACAPGTFGGAPSGLGVRPSACGSGIRPAERWISNPRRIPTHKAAVPLPNDRKRVAR
jgi:hypothetical protein